MLPHLDRLYSAAMRYTRNPPTPRISCRRRSPRRSVRSTSTGRAPTCGRGCTGCCTPPTSRCTARRNDAPRRSAGEIDDYSFYDEIARSGGPSAEREVLEALTADEVKQALADLPDTFREAVYLADVEGFPYKDIAEIMDTPVGTVMSRLHRGRKQLQKALAGYARARGLLDDDGGGDAERRARTPGHGPAGASCEPVPRLRADCQEALAELERFLDGELPSTTSRPGQGAPHRLLPVHRPGVVRGAAPGASSGATAPTGAAGALLDRIRVHLDAGRPLDRRVGASSRGRSRPRLA